MSDIPIMAENWEEGLWEQLSNNAEGAAMEIENSNLEAVYEEFYIGAMVARMGLNTDPDDMKVQRLILTAQMAWVMSGLQLGYTDRVQEDHEGSSIYADNL
ncbi:hypothetical protein [Halodesulfurarchaeum formicicum]|uniref:hypothetical protein n=1 Tax=Halodesulfurarchaeum formicicum TaxID=1873524 RepID=UPI000AD3EDBC|nr:hypothetical protein [Halodesulfurarchaeum formicicum]